MKNGTTELPINLAFVFLLCLLTNYADAQIVDLSTDEAVLAEMQKRADAKREKLGLVNKIPGRLTARSVCIEMLKASEKVIVIRFFRSDYGCHFDGAFVGSQYLEASDTELSKKALDELGWQKAPKREREMLAAYWVEKGLLAFFTVLYTRDLDLSESEFHVPRAVTRENREVHVALWSQLPTRMRRGKEFQHREFRFAGDGNLLEK